MVVDDFEDMCRGIRVEPWNIKIFGKKQTNYTSISRHQDDLPPTGLERVAYSTVVFVVVPIWPRSHVEAWSHKFAAVFCLILHFEHFLLGLFEGVISHHLEGLLLLVELRVHVFSEFLDELFVLFRLLAHKELGVHLVDLMVVYGHPGVCYARAGLVPGGHVEVVGVGVVRDLRLDVLGEPGVGGEHHRAELHEGGVGLEGADVSGGLLEVVDWDNRLAYIYIFQMGQSCVGRWLGRGC